MKNSILFSLLIGVAVVAGCASKTRKPITTQPGLVAPQLIVTPDISVAAKVVSVNSVGHFVVLGFPGGNLPKLLQTLSLYRAGLKVAEVKITGPQSDNNIVADILSGEAKAGDTVRDQ